MDGGNGIRLTSQTGRRVIASPCRRLERRLPTWAQRIDHGDRPGCHDPTLQTSPNSSSSVGTRLPCLPDDDCRRYLTLLREPLLDAECHLHAYG